VFSELRAIWVGTFKEQLSTQGVVLVALPRLFVMAFFFDFLNQCSGSAAVRDLGAALDYF